MLTYVRTYEITYDRTTNEKMPQLNTKLFTNGVRTCNKYSSDLDDHHYGMQEYEDRETLFMIDMMGKVGVMDFLYRSDAQKAIEQLIKAFPDEPMHMYEESKVKSGEKEKGPRGEYLIHTDYDYCLRYYNPNQTVDEDVKVVATLHTTYNETKLKFVITWQSEKVARKPKIEQKCVDAPLAIMGKIQHVVEKSLKELNDWETEVFDNAEIGCHFDVISESRSECTPDIIERVRAEKRKNEEEE